MAVGSEISPLMNQLSDTLTVVSDQYHQLLFWASTAPVTVKQLKSLSGQVNGCIINLNLELSGRLIELPRRQWAYQAPSLISDIFSSADCSVVIVNHIEVLFSEALKLDPVRCLQQVARHRTVIAVWPGELSDKYLTYAGPEHPEYRRYARKDYLIFESLL